MENNSKKPTISIITPVYNTKKYLNRCVKSIVSQTMKDFELILVDDGSTDGSLELCKEWEKKDNRIIVIHQENAGAGAARNRGLSEARGEFIGFVDSDDWIENNMYEILFSALKDNPIADLAECKIYRTQGGRFEKNENKAFVNDVMNQTDLLKKFFRVDGGDSDYGIYTKLLRKRVVEEFSFIEGTISEDVMASYYFYTHCNKAVIVNKELYYYYQNPSGVTRKKVTCQDFEYIEAFKRIHEDIKKNMPKLQAYSKINFIRSNFTILSKMKLMGYDKNDKNLVCKYREMKKIVRLNLYSLLRWKMPVSRKLLLLYVCI